MRYLFLISVLLFNVTMPLYIYLRFLTKLNLINSLMSSYYWLPWIMKGFLVFISLSPWIYFFAGRFNFLPSMLTIPASIVFGIFSLLSLVAITFDIFRCIGLLLLRYVPLSSTSVTYLEVATITLVVVYMVASFVIGFKYPVIKKVNISIDSFPFKNYKVVQISDLHLGPILKRKFVTYVVNTINQLEPDLVVITGDLNDFKVDVIREDLQLLGQIKSKHGTYFVLGNHEYYNGLSDIVKFLPTIKIKLLINESVKIGDEDRFFNLIGVGESLIGYPNLLSSDFEAAVSKRDTSKPSILLAHNPRFIENIDDKDKIDLLLAGHTHGGQIFPFHFFSKIFHPYLSGLHKHSDSTQVYVNRGTGFWGPPVRMFKPGEITEIIINSQ